MTETIWGSTTKPASSERLARRVSSLDLDGTLYIGYPVIGTPEGPFTVDALWLSPSNGLILFDVIEGKELGDYKNRQDEYVTTVQAKLLQHKQLIRNRKLAFEIGVVTYAPAKANLRSEEDSKFPVAN